MYYAIDLLFALAVGLWVYGDARQRKLHNALTWGLLGLLFGLLGLIAYWYWVIRPNKRSTRPKAGKK